MIGHEAIGPAGDAIGLATLGEKVAIKRVVAFAREQRLATIAALRDMMGSAGEDDASEPSHGGDLAERRKLCNWYAVTVIPRT